MASVLHQPAQYNCVSIGYQRIDAFPGFEFVYTVGKLAYTTMQGIELVVTLIQAPFKVEDANNARKIDAFIGKLIDQLQTLNIGLRLHARVAPCALGGNQALLFIDAQSLRVNASKFGSNTDHIQRSVFVFHYHALTSSLVASWNASRAFFCSSFNVFGTAILMATRKSPLPVEPLPNLGAPLPRTVRTVPS